VSHSRKILVFMAFIFSQVAASLGFVILDTNYDIRNDFRSTRLHTNRYSVIRTNRPFHDGVKQGTKHLRMSEYQGINTGCELHYTL
jgi:hypothetical protein